MEEIDSLNNKHDLTVTDIHAMKVADLRRELKAKGLPTAGNKTELADRLLTAFALPKGADKSESSDDVNEDEVLGDDVLLQDDVKVQEDISEEELFGSPTKDKNNILVTKDCKEDSGGGGGEAKQKIQLTRTLKTFPSVAKKSESNHQKVSMSSTKKDADDSAAGTKKADSATTTKPLSEAERLSLRAKRFNLEASEQPKVGRMKTTNTSTTSAAKITSNVTATVSQLKKRAERFGQNVSSVMKQVEEKEMLLKRKARFGQTVTSLSVATGVADSASVMKKKRLERFGLRQ